MGDINERLSWISAERLKKDIVDNKVDLFLKPPVQDFGVLEFDKFDQIVQIGYDYSKPLVEQWANENGYSKTKA
jgi:predicted acylesterase/phospholipase RssA